MTESKRSLPTMTKTERGPMADFVFKTAIAAGVGLLALVIAVEWTLASLDEFVNRNSELAIARLEQAIRSNTQIITTDLRSTAQTITADLRSTAQTITADLRGAAQTTVADLRDATSGSRLVARVERGIEWLADPTTEMSPERRERLLAAVRVASARWRPVLLEALAIAAGAEGTDVTKK